MININSHKNGISTMQSDLIQRLKNIEDRFGQMWRYL